MSRVIGSNSNRHRAKPHDIEFDAKFTLVSELESNKFTDDSDIGISEADRAYEPTVRHQLRLLSLIISPCSMCGEGNRLSSQTSVWSYHITSQYFRGGNLSRSMLSILLRNCIGS